MRNKKRIIIIVLCMAVLFLAVVYAAFATKLTISSKGNITSNWNVYFESITSTVTGNAYNIETPSVSGTTAHFRVGLKLPGDKMQYRIKVTNAGTVDAYISDLKINNTSSTKIITKVTPTVGIKKGSKLNAGRSGYLTIAVELDPLATSLPEDNIGNITIELTTVQYTDQVIEREDSVIETKRLNSLILRDNTAQEDTNIDFSQVSSSTNGKGLYYTNTNTENNAKTYYFRGAVENNYVSFAGSTWRIVRINEDESIRLIKQDSIGSNVFNSISDVDNSIVGYMYGIPAKEKSKYGDIDGNGSLTNADVTLLANMYGKTSSTNRNSYFADLNLDNNINLNDKALLRQLINKETTIDNIWANVPSTLKYNRAHSNLTNSDIKTALDNWYNTNLSKYSSYIADSGFCGDRSIASTPNTWSVSDYATGYGYDSTLYGAYNRLNNLQKPQFACPQTNDLYTTSTATKGNKALTYPVGLISIDEIIYSGGVVGMFLDSNNSYLSSTDGIWTMSPSSTGIVYTIDPDGGVSGQIPSNSYVSGTYPVINLKASTTVKSGTGTATDPYVIN